MKPTRSRDCNFHFISAFSLLRTFVTVAQSFGLLIISMIFSATTFDLEENQKRWVVIGICLNRLLLPVLRDFARREISKHYVSLKRSSNIDSQVYPAYKKKDGSFDFNYGSINNNWRNFKRKERLYDYKVLTAEDLAKLYLEPKMALFTGNKLYLFSLLPNLAIANEYLLRQLSLESSALL